MRLINSPLEDLQEKLCPSDTLKTDFLPEKAGVLLRENLKEILIDAWELTPIPLSSLLKIFFGGRERSVLPIASASIECSVLYVTVLSFGFLLSQKAKVQPQMHFHTLTIYLFPLIPSSLQIPKHVCQRIGAYGQKAQINLQILFNLHSFRSQDLLWSLFLSYSL